MVKRYKPTRLSNSGRLTRRAAQVLRDREWVQGQVGLGDVGMCAIGAISFAASGTTEHATTLPAELFLDYLYGRSNEKTRLINETIVDFGNWLLDSGHHINASIPSWNDAEDRTKEDVILYMEKFADEVDPRKV